MPEVLKSDQSSSFFVLERPGGFAKEWSMTKYDQYCPVARASEIFADRWTPLIVRELLAGSLQFNRIERGLPGISRSLLAARLGGRGEEEGDGETDPSEPPPIEEEDSGEGDDEDEDDDPDNDEEDDDEDEDDDEEDAEYVDYDDDDDEEDEDEDA